MSDPWSAAGVTPPTPRKEDPMLERIKSEPALVAGVVQALLAVLVAFGVPLSDVQVAAVLGLSAAVLAVVVRSKVTPTR